MWFVGIKRPYYPSIEIVETEEEATRKYNELLSEHDQDGKYESLILYGKVTNITHINTHY
jgi:hypothetical protein